MSRSRSPVQERTANLKAVLKSQDDSAGGLRDEMQRTSSELMVMDQSVELASIHGGGRVLEPASPDLSIEKDEDDNKSLNLDIHDDLKNESALGAGRPDNDQKETNSQTDHLRKPMSATVIDENNEHTGRSSPSRPVGKTPQAATSAVNIQRMMRKSSQGSMNRNGGSTNRSPKNSFSRRSRSRSDLETNSMNNISAIEGELHLSEKLQKYINRIAVTCMSPLYAARYVRDWKRRNKANAQKLLLDDADLAAQAELLGQIGYKATLQKLRYSDEKPPPTPKKDNRRGVRR